MCELFCQYPLLVGVYGLISAAIGALLALILTENE